MTFCYQVNYQGTSSSSCTTWVAWCDQHQHNQQTTGSIGYYDCWPSWNLAVEEANEAYRARQEAVVEHERKQELARKVAEALLLENLDAAQAKQFRTDRTFVVSSRNTERRYRVTYGVAGNIFQLDSQGKQVAKFCIHPNVACPTEDIMLAQKLLIEADEDQFWKVANKTNLAA